MGFMAGCAIKTLAPGHTSLNTPSLGKYWLKIESIQPDTQAVDEGANIQKVKNP